MISNFKNKFIPLGFAIGITLAILSCGGGGGYNITPTDPNINTAHPLDEGLPDKVYSHPSDAYDITKELPAGYKKDGSVDYTEYIQAGLDKKGKLLMPDFPILINKSGLNVSSNTQLYFQKNSLLKMQANASDLTFILKLVQAENVQLHNLHLKGDRNEHLGSTGEWGMGVYLSGSKNVNISNGTFTDFWGDGIYLGDETWTDENENIQINYCHVKNSRRSGISIISGKNIAINNCIFEGSNGPTHASGITIEPNKAKQEIDNINIQNCLTKNNAKVGLRFVFTAFYNNESLLKNVNINIDNYKDDGSQYGISFVLNHPTNTNGINKGVINLSNLIFEDNIGHAIVDYPYIPGTPVLFNCYFDDVLVVMDGNKNTKETTYLNNLIDGKTYFHWVK